MNIHNSIEELIGNTPLLRLGKINEGNADILLKLEFFNPSGSVKDRAALYMLNAAEKSGLLKKGSLIVEPTSGNTGIALAMLAARRRYRIILTMPESMSSERRKLLAAYGAEIVLTPAAGGMKGAVEKALEIKRQNPDAFIPQQFSNAANTLSHYETSAEEIWRDTGGKVDAVVAGVGTGGTVSGIGRRLKELKSDVKIFAVEPSESAVLSGKPAGIHKIQGIGAGFVPEIYDTKIVDEVLAVSSEDAGVAARKAAGLEGVLVGISAGAAIHAANELSKRTQFAGKTIVAIVPDGGVKYLSTWLFD